MPRGSHPSQLLCYSKAFSFQKQSNIAVSHLKVEIWIWVSTTGLWKPGLVASNVIWLLIFFQGKAKSEFEMTRGLDLVALTSIRVISCYVTLSENSFTLLQSSHYIQVFTRYTAHWAHCLVTSAFRFSLYSFKAWAHLYWIYWITLIRHKGEKENGMWERVVSGVRTEGWGERPWQGWFCLSLWKYTLWKYSDLFRHAVPL